MRVVQVYFLAYWLFQDSLPPASNCNFDDAKKEQLLSSYCYQLSAINSR